MSWQAGTSADAGTLEAPPESGEVEWLDPALWYDRIVEAWHFLTPYLVAWVIAIALAWALNWVAKRILVRGVHKLVGRTQATWDDDLVKNKVFEKLSHLAPALAFTFGSNGLTWSDSGAATIRRLALVWMILAGGRTASAFLNAMISYGRRHQATQDKPIRSYIQVVQILLWLGVGVVSLATLADRSPWGVLTGFGALSAILLLVFKDSILGFVASIQIATNDMLRIGDWVEVPKYGADGDVILIGLHTVKVQNWDKTISTIPTHAFMADSFKNWRGMTESGGRRIKRSLSLDLASVRFLDEEDLARLRKIAYLKDYLDEKESELATWNEEKRVDPTSRVNGRRLTNLGTFRAYLESYLKSLPEIDQGMTFLVRQLAPSPEGIPIEIYVFSSEQRWAQYEAIMADIFDHLFASVDEFDLRVFQRPTGADLTSLTRA